jgi:hypothetical protein
MEVLFGNSSINDGFKKNIAMFDYQSASGRFWIKK